MKKYFIRIADDQKGPFSIEELKIQNITSSTFVWFEGLENWIEASKVEELQSILGAVPPPFNRTGEPSDSSSSAPKDDTPKPSKRGLTSLQWIGVALLAVFLCVTIISNLRRNDRSGGAYESKVKTVLEIEQESPTKFLKATGNYRENFWGNKFVLDLKVENNATVANYKDVILEINLYSATNTLLKTINHTCYEYFKAHEQKTFELRIEKPRNTEKVGIDIQSAVPV